MATGKQEVTVVIPTMCASERKATIWRAVESVRGGGWDRVRPLVVVNGQRVDRRLLGELSGDPSISVRRVEEASLPRALEVGVQEVDSPYFCFLDDDDEYLPGAIGARVAALDAAPQADVVVTNGWREREGDRELALRRLGQVAVDPLSALFAENWMASCGGMFRAETVGAEFFDDVQPYFEWTWMAFRVAKSGLRVKTLDAPTFVIHDTPGSASKSDAYGNGQVSLYERMLAVGLRDDLRVTVRRRLAVAWHDVAARNVARGDWGGAWRAHLRSLAYPGGWRYLTYSRRLLAARRWGRWA